MASIGGRTVLRLKGIIEPATGEKLQDITRPGVDGVAYRKVGKRASRTQLTTIVDLASGNVETEIDEYKALEGTLVTIVDEAGITWSNVAVLMVRPLPIRRVASSVGGINGGTRILTCQWVVQATETD